MTPKPVKPKSEMKCPYCRRFVHGRGYAREAHESTCPAAWTPPIAQFRKPRLPVATAEMVDAVVAGAVARPHEMVLLRRMAAWLAWEAGCAWWWCDFLAGRGTMCVWGEENATRLSRIALRAIDAAQPGQYLWRREWAWRFYAEMKAPKVAQEGTR